MSQRREFKAFGLQELKADMVARTFRGYAATWDEDLSGDVIGQGAFAKTIAERGPRQLGDGSTKSDIKILWQHDRSMPIGLPTVMREDTKGLYVEGAVIDTECGMMAMKCLAAGVVDKMSIGYTVIKSETRYDPDSGDYEGRNISEMKLYEFSPVTFPINDGADITGTKAHEREISMARLLEASLPLLTSSNAGAVLKAIEKEGEAPAWLKSFLRALVGLQQPPSTGTGTPAAQQPPDDKTDPPKGADISATSAIDVDTQSFLKRTKAFNETLSEMLLRKTSGV